MSTSSIMHHHSTPYAAAAAVVVAAAAVVSLSLLSLSGSGSDTNIAPPSSPSIGAQFNHPPVGGGHLTAG